MKKTKKLLFIFCMMLLCCLSFTSCKKDKQELVPPTRIDYNIENTYISVGQTKQVNLGFTPTNAISDVTLFSSDESIVSVKDTYIQGIATGKAIISAISKEDESVKVSFYVTVYSVPTSLTCYTKNETMALNSQLNFRTVVEPFDANPYIRWTSSNPSVIAINASGIATAVSLGSATITGVSDANPNLVYEKNLTVVEEAEEIEVVVPKYSDYIGSTIKLTSTVYPQTVSQDVQWTSSNPSIASVDENGLVSLVSRGEAVITCTSKNNATISKAIKLTSVHPLLEEENSDVKYIICAPGTDASTMISINYHAKNTKTSVEYTLATDTQFNNKVSLLANGVYFEELSEELSVPFEARNVYSLEITNLLPNTDYIYRINCGDGTYSDTYHFRTASNSADNFSFVWLTDNHYNTIYPGAEVSEFTIHEAMKKRDHISFVLDTGDMIDTGGNADIWDLMFKDRKTLLELPMVSTTGNHELYVKSTAQWDNRFHAAYNALPKNGVEKKVGTSCYFYYNDVLFIMFEDVAASSYDLQFAWMENLLRDARENNRAKMVIAACHAPIQSESASDSKNDRDTKIMALFEKYSVDLVLTGHYHSHYESKDYWEGTYWKGPQAGNGLLGVNYLTGAAAGAKGASDTDIESLKTIAKGYIVDIIGTTIKVTQIDAAGNVLKELSYDSKKYETVTEEAKNSTKEEIVNSLTYVLNQSNTNITFKWSKLAYGNVNKIIFNELNRNEETKEVHIINSAFTSTTLSNALNDYDSYYKATIYFYDGEVITKEFEVNRGPDLKLNITLEGNATILNIGNPSTNIKNVIEKLEIYINDEKIDTVTYLTNSLPLRTYILNHLKSGETYNIEVKFINSSNIVMFTNSVTLSM